MAWIGGSAGVFRLHDSDDNCGSMISLVDAAEIFEVQVNTLTALADTALKIVEIEDEKFINELDLHLAWGSGAIPTAHPPKIDRARRSLDELILMKLIKIVYPKCSVTPQKKAGRKWVDLFVDVGGNHVAIEFFGPSHFIQQYSREITPPSDRKILIERFLGCECVIWPYWIQRCESNVRALFDRSAEGKASMWSTKAHFGDFVLPNSSEIVIALSSRFNAIETEGIGYMYLDSRTKNKPVHPIVKRIMDGKDKMERLIPRGNDKPNAFWLPKCIKSV